MNATTYGVDTYPSYDPPTRCSVCAAIIVHKPYGVRVLGTVQNTPMVPPNDLDLTRALTSGYTNRRVVTMLRLQGWGSYLGSECSIGRAVGNLLVDRLLRFGPYALYNIRSWSFDIEIHPNAYKAGGIPGASPR